MNPTEGSQHSDQYQKEAEDPSQGIASAKRLLARKPEEKYIGEWTKRIGQEQEERKDKHDISAILFRLGPKWLAIPATVFSEIFSGCTIHTIPLRSNAMLLGLVNFRGKLALCVNMQEALGINADPLYLMPSVASSQLIMIAIQKDGELWVFPVSELFGIYRCGVASIENIPQQALKLKNNYLRGFINWKGKQVDLIDEELLFSKLRMDIL